MQTKTLSARSIVVLTMFAIALATLMPALASAQTETVIHAFQSADKYDGFNPNASLIADANGALYGTTTTGGKHGWGTVFKLVPPAAPGGAWTQDVLYSFTGGADGSEPSPGSLLLKGNSLYGTTSQGGSNGVGVAYELTPGKPWQETVLYTFVNNSTGFDPSSGLTLGSNGTFYGTTLKGGAHKVGAVYRLSPPSERSSEWTEAPIYSFNSAIGDGIEPAYSLIFDSTGALYGVTVADGGTIFKLTPSSSGFWTETILYSFNGGTDGGGPYSGVVFDSSGALYGATFSSGSSAGNVYKLTPPSGGTSPWTETILWAFQGTPGNDGADPTGVVFDSTGTIYGSTQYGGTNDGCGVLGCGTVFSLAPPASPGGAWTEQVLYSFQASSDGTYPDTQLLLSGGVYYGTTAAGGGKANAGTVFSFVP